MRTPGPTATRAWRLAGRRAGSALLLGCTSIAIVTARANAQVVLPQGGTVASGQVKIGAPAGNALTINQTSSKAIVDWNSFSVGANASVDIIQPNAGSAILNRVTGTTPSTIAGRITANGQVFLVNPNGIAITPTGSVQVGGGFVASTLDIGNADFNAGNLNFSGKGASAAVSNAGRISAAAGSFVGLIGGAVANSGTITVPLGTVGLGAGEKVTLNPTGDGFLQVTVPTGATAADGRALIDVAGRVTAAGGTVEIKAATAQQAMHDVVNVSGSISARSVSGRSGNIVLDGGSGTVTVSGRIGADGSRRNKGGTIVVTGSKVALSAAAKVTANGTSGGTVLIGGDLHGGTNASAKLVATPVKTAATTSIAEGATISANGSSGNGGNVVVWSDTLTDFRGSIEATGGSAGNGGAVEVSSHGVLGFAGRVDVTAASGKTGTLLLDPYDVTISSGSDSNIANSSNNFTPTGNSSILSVSTLQSALATANVTVSTGSSGSQNGDITVANPVSWSSGNTLALNAAGAVNVNAAITATNGGSLSLTGTTIAVNGTSITLGGTLAATATASGTSTAVSLSNAAISVGSGASTIGGTSPNGFGVDISGTTSLAASTGSFTVNGLSQAPSITFGGGLDLQPGTALTTAGSITLNGTGGTVGFGHGIVLQSGASVTSSGALTMQGVTDTSANNRYGIYFVGNNSVTASSGTMSLTGTATTSGTGIEQNGGTLTLTNNGTGAFSVTGTSSSYFGLDLAVGTLLATAGPISVSGSSTSSVGFDFSGNNAVTASSGALTLNGTSTSNDGILLRGTVALTNSGATTFSLIANTSTYRALELLGASSTNVTVSGNASFSGTSNTGTGVIFGTSSAFNVSSGNVTVSGVSSATTGSGATLGTHFATASVTNSGSGSLSITGTSDDQAATANLGSAGVLFTGTNSLGNSGSGTLSVSGVNTSGYGLQLKNAATLATSGTMSIAGTSSAGYGVLFGSVNTVTASSGNLTISGATASGSAGINSSSGGNAITNDGSGTLTLDGIGGDRLGATITSSSGDLVISDTGAVTQSAGTITAGHLLLSGTGSFSLGQANMVGTIAANAGAVAFVNHQNLTIGTVLTTSGITTTGAATIQSSGNLTLASGAGVSGASPVLSAAGAFINGAGGTAVTASSGRWLIYSGAPGSDAFGGLNSSNTAIWNATYATLAPGSVSATGNRYLFAYQPTLTFTSANASKIYGTDATAAIALNYSASGYQGGVSNAFLGDNAASTFTGAPSVTSTGAAATASVTGSPYAVTVAQGSLAAISGYALAFNNGGTLTVNPAPVTVTALGGSSTYGASPSNPGLSATGLQNGQGVNVLTGLSNSFGISNTTNVGSYVLSVIGTLTNPNYTLAGTSDGTWSVNPTPVPVLRGSLADGPSHYIPGLSVSAPRSGDSGVLNGLANASDKVNTGNNARARPSDIAASRARPGFVAPVAGNKAGSRAGSDAGILPANSPPVSVDAPTPVADAPPVIAAKPRGLIDFALQKLNRDALVDAFNREFAEVTGAGRGARALLMTAFAATSLGLTVGIVTWLLRNGALLSALLSSMPLWRGFDPLPILTRPIRRDEEPSSSDVDLLFDDTRTSGHSTEVSGHEAIHNPNAADQYRAALPDDKPDLHRLLVRLPSKRRKGGAGSARENF
jgi:filamentous hemagglutinin family protein